jgi:phosphoribosyl-AMP cyclohydrolase
MIELEFDKRNGLVPAIAQDYRSGEVLMLAFMNEEAWRKTLDTGIAHYWSRSRKQLWKKGESSGNIQEVREIRVDCDRDSVLLKVHQVGEAACHTGHRSCFFNLIRDGEVVPDGQIIFDPKDKYGTS